ncbi:hypothetical protein [Pantoea ananatis]|jgi:hypothetical protein|uniref:hypothetical protein n=1 Tax=Pantoea ananas TaxID=553 RepID=UPI000D93A975|nr:hypothetical protein [Pantoea ananatis]PWV58816.1 hypothetical protein C7425_1242 [Pantoea ananatis]PWV83271.1 hypothetical protein C7426_1283 [Pantoea ananatis]REC88686.1 hypothetical protein C7423_1313 [Pantoea ananatis]
MHQVPDAGQDTCDRTKPANEINDTNYTDGPRAGDNINRRSLRKRLSRYGFTECSSLVCFLDVLCCERPGQSELLYIWSRLRECLWTHDEGGAWFDDLRLMEQEVSRALKIQLRKCQAGGLLEAVTCGCSCAWKKGGA